MKLNRIINKKSPQDLLKSMLILMICLIYFKPHAQVFDDFTDGDFTSNPIWIGDTQQFQITSSSAIPPEMKPALQLYASSADTSVLLLPNTMMMNTEWHFWLKLSFNTSANNYARVYLVSDQENLKGSLNGYFVQVGGATDSLSLFRQTGLICEEIIPGSVSYTGNSTNVFRIKVTRDNQDIWQLYSSANGGFDYLLEGSCEDETYVSASYFGIYCKFTSSNSEKFYFDDFYIGQIVMDTVPPEIIDVTEVEQNQLDVSFSEPVEINSSQNTMNYLVNSVGNPESATRDLLDPSLVHLVFNTEFQPGIQYTITISNIADNAGNILTQVSATFEFLQPYSISLFDITITEIMTDINPPPAGLPEADYLELYNRTSGAINLEECTVKPRESSEPLIFPEVWIAPDSFLLVVQPSDVAAFEPFGPVVGLSGFSMNNEGCILIRNPQGSLICAVNYSDEWYNDEVKKTGGWSLEMIDTGHPCSGSQGWTASIDLSGGTPGKTNSVENLIVTLPEIESVQITGSNTIKILFSHFMDSLSLCKTTAYSINEGIGLPVSISMTGNEFNNVLLGFISVFQENVNYQLCITDTLFNCSGDFIPLNSFYDLIMPADAGIFDVVINEIMSDPDPPNGLPEYEYVEIYNTTASFLRVENWVLQIGTTDKAIPSFIIEPEEYLIFSEDEASGLFGMLARTIGFSSLGLTNSGTSVKLLNPEGAVISSVSYRDDWYGDSEKAEGGWSLEQIDPLNPCPGKDNWKASLDERGGSPGSENSVNSQNPVDPLATKVIAIDDKTFEVYFNQWMDGSSLINSNDYYVDRGIGNPVQAYVEESSLNSVVIAFPQSLERKKIYTLSFSSNIKSCIGQPVSQDHEILFGIPEKPAQNDVIINEVLFNPADDGVDFVEIYNRSEKIIDIREIMLGTIEVNQLEPNDTVLKSVSDENALLLSNEYLVITPDPEKVMEQYFTPNPAGFTRMNSFPAFNNDEGSIILAGYDGSVVDAFYYDEAMHYPLINSVDGVSLERLNFNRPASDPTNWHSASEDCGFATPAYKNSQFTESSETNDEISIDPEIFSPDNDGFDDVANILYCFDSPGYSCSISVFDAQGRLVHQLVSNELLGTEGVFSWDGRTDAGQKAGIGIYIIYFEAFDLNGKIKRFKKPVVLAGKF